MLRFILIVLYVAFIAFPISLPCFLLCLIAGLFSDRLRSALALGFLQLVMRGLILLAGVKVEAVGTENIPAGPVYFVSNHRGFYDIFTTYQYLSGRICGTVSKKEWGKIPYLNIWMKMIHCVFLDRSNPRAGLASTKEVIRELEAGHCFYVYPEGTRNHGPGIGEFKEGSFRAAFVTGTAVLPVTILHSDDVFELHKPFVHPTRMTLVFGKPHETKGLERSEHKTFIHELHEEMVQNYERYY